MNQKFTIKPSPVVIHHIESLLHPLPEASPGISHFHPGPKQQATAKETQLFWRYHGHFPQEFVKALEHNLPNNYKFVQYDHLQNLLTVEVV